ncbi:MAG: hypothetical protein HFJ53_00830 [Clostridia bacterium]|nr:hypothetical protein [Clostridia bacterium]
MKKIISIIFMLLLTVSIVGCSGTKEQREIKRLEERIDKLEALIASEKTEIVNENMQIIEKTESELKNLKNSKNGTITQSENSTEKITQQQNILLPPIETLSIEEQRKEYDGGIIIFKEGTPKHWAKGLEEGNKLEMINVYSDEEQQIQQKVEGIEALYRMSSKYSEKINISSIIEQLLEEGKESIYLFDNGIDENEVDTSIINHKSFKLVIYTSGDFNKNWLMQIKNAYPNATLRVIVN